MGLDYVHAYIPVHDCTVSYTKHNQLSNNMNTEASFINQPNPTRFRGRFLARSTRRQCTGTSFLIRKFLFCLTLGYELKDMHILLNYGSNTVNPI